MTLLSLLQGYNDLKMQDHYVEQHRFQKPAGGIMSRAGEEHLHGGVAGATTQALLFRGGKFNFLIDFSHKWEESPPDTTLVSPVPPGGQAAVKHTLGVPESRRKVTLVTGS